MELLYHYTKPKTAIKILTSHQFKFGHLHNTNDPFEKLINRYSHSDFQDKEPEVEDYMMKLVAYMNENIAVGCFGTGNNMIRGDEKWTMWAHYANKHLCVCLVFDKKKFLENVKTNSLDPLSQLIDYKKTFRLDPILFKQYINESFETFLRRFQTPMLFTKHEDWFVENEFRIVVFEREFSVSIANCINCVMLGPEISPEYSNDIKEIVKQKFQALTVGDLQYNSNRYIRSLNLYLSDMLTIQ
jgi:hypothetical protein